MPIFGGRDEAKRRFKEAKRCSNPKKKEFDLDRAIRLLEEAVSLRPDSDYSKELDDLRKIKAKSKLNLTLHCILLNKVYNKANNQWLTGGHAMIARLGRFQVNMDKLDEVKKAFEKGVIPAAKLQKGYRSGYLLTDHKTGKCISITFWDSEKDAVADEQSGQYRERVDMGKDRQIAPPIREL